MDVSGVEIKGKEGNEHERETCLRENTASRARWFAAECYQCYGLGDVIEPTPPHPGPSLES